MLALILAAFLAALAGVAGCGNESPDGAVKTPRAEADGRLSPGEATSSADAATSSSARTTWAVIVSDNVAKTGLVDLLFAELSTLPDIKLVERERLRDVATELELNAFNSPETIEKRIALGKTLSADRLLIMTADDPKEPPTGSTLALDTASGVQLGQLRVSLAKDRIEKESRYLTRWVRDLQTQYRGGVQAVVGVPFFISKSLDRRFESFQRDYARVLTGALVQTPGVAVVSIEESRFIAQELALRGETMAPVVPLFVEGEYSSEADTPDSSCHVTLKVVISDSKGSLAVMKRSNISGDDVPQFLTGEVAGRIVELAVGGDAKPLAPQQVEQKLIHTADRLAGMACFSESATLRDTVALIDPGNVDERIKCLNDYLAGGGTDVVYVFPRFDYLVRNRLINFSQGATFLAKAQNFDFGRAKESGDETLPREIVDAYAFRRYYLPRLCSLPAPTCEAETTFAAKRSGESQPFTEAQRVARKFDICLAVYSQFRGPMHSDSRWDGYRSFAVDDICRLFRDLPQEYLTWYPAQDLKDAAKAWHAREKRLLRERFEASGDARLKLLAGYLSLGMKAMAHPEELTHADRDEILRLRETLRALRSRKESPVIPRVADYFDQSIQEVATVIERQLAEDRRLSGRPVNPITEPPEPLEATPAELAIELIDDWPSVAEPLHLGFHPSSEFATIVRKPSRQRHVRLEKHTEGVDVAWDEVSVRLLTENAGTPTLSKPILVVGGDPAQAGSDFILEVRSDGTYLWIATVEQGILAFNAEGTRVAQFDESIGLPAYLTSSEKIIQRQSDKGREVYPRGQKWQHAFDLVSPGSDWHTLTDYFGLRVRPTEPAFQIYYASVTLVPVGGGECLAIGRVDANRRLWIALLRTSGPDKRPPSVEVIHTAPRLLPVEEYETPEFVGAANLIDVAFNVPWTCIYRNPKKENDRVCIVGRWHDGYRSNCVYNTPLAIDLNTWRVTTLAERLPQFAEVAGGTAAECLDGSMLVVHESRLLAYVPQSDGLAERRLLSKTTPSQNNYLVRYKDSVISPGREWYRVSPHPDSGVDARVIAAETIPRQHELNHYSESGVHGLFAATYEGDLAYRIVPGPHALGRQSAFARYVPRTKLPAHDRAVAAIRGLGGFVDRTDRCRLARSVLGDSWRKASLGIREWLDARPCHRTIVCLTESWKGGDAGLRHLLDLHAVSTLYILGAPITDNGMAYVAKLDGLEELYLVETHVTNDGLAATLGNRALRCLHLQSGSEHLVGDAALEHLPADNQLEYLAIQGHTFTKACVPHLTAARGLRYLWLLETSIPPATYSGIVQTYRQATGRPITIFDE